MKFKPCPRKGVNAILRAAYMIFTSAHRKRSVVDLISRRFSPNKAARVGVGTVYTNLTPHRMELGGGLVWIVSYLTRHALVEGFTWAFSFS